MTSNEQSIRGCVIAMRHAERTDYKVKEAGGSWQSTSPRPWDTTITENGLDQSTAAGKAIRDILERHNLPMISEAYSSPLIRCCQTISNTTRASNSTAEKIKIEHGLAESLTVNCKCGWFCR